MPLDKPETVSQTDTIGAAHALPAGIAPGTAVMTLDGLLPVEHLLPGDRVITRCGIAILQDIRVHEDPGPCLAVSNTGPGRPRDSVAFGAGQTILLRDWRARAMFGRASAVVALSRLADGEAVAPAATAPARLIEPVFATPQVIYAGGLEVLCPGLEAEPARAA